MADLSVTIAAQTSMLGMAPPNLWGAYNWGAFLWGTTEDIPVQVEKAIASTVAPDSANAFDVDHVLDAETMTLDSTSVFGFSLAIDEAMTTTGDLGGQTLMDGGAYSYVFPDAVTDGEDRVFSTWTSGTAASNAWTSGTVTSTSWT